MGELQYSGSTAQRIGMVRTQLGRWVDYQSGRCNKPVSLSTEDHIAEEIYRTRTPLTSVTDREIEERIYAVQRA